MNNSTSSAIYLIQQRVPCIRGKSNEFVEEFTQLLPSIFGQKVNLVLTTGAAMTTELNEDLNLIKSKNIFNISNFTKTSVSSIITEDKYIEKIIRNLLNLSEVCTEIELDTIGNTIPHGMLVSRCVLMKNQKLNEPLHVTCIGKLCYEGHGNNQDGSDLGGILSSMILM